MSLFISPRIERLINLAIEEDELGFDVTSQVFFEGEQSRARLVAKQDLVVCGLSMVQAVYKRVDPGVTCVFEVNEGHVIEKGTVLGTLQGDSVSLLRGERIALNFLQRMSGVATLTSQFVKALNSPTTRIVDTRKTLPGWRELDKYAVRSGGGGNHRFNLASGVMIKDNHIAAAGGIAEAVKRVQKLTPHAVRIEVEVTTLEQVDEALQANVEIIMLDNMDTAQMTAAIERIRSVEKGRRTLIEASGNMSLERLPELQALDLDYISVGALTHSATAVDISMRF